MEEAPRAKKLKTYAEPKNSLVQKKRYSQTSTFDNNNAISNNNGGTYAAQGQVLLHMKMLILRYLHQRWTLGPQTIFLKTTALFWAVPDAYKTYHVLRQKKQQQHGKVTN